MKTILAVDCATRTGWAVVRGGQVLASGMQDFRRRKGDHPGHLFLEFRKWCDCLAVIHGAQMLAYEQAHHRGRAATEICVGLTTRVLEVGSMHGLPVVAVHSSKVKMAATGKGNADKQAMHDAAWRILGRVPVDDNEADAVFLGLHVSRREDTNA